MLWHLSSSIPERVAVDIGCFRGSYVDLFRRAGFKVFAFEPIPSRVADLRAKWSNDPNVRIERVAVSDEDGLADIFLGDWKVPEEFDLNPGDLFNTLEARPANSVLAFKSKLRVVRRRLAWFVDRKLIPPRIGILKIDTEGHDEAVLRGAWPYLGRITMCEYWSKDFIFNEGRSRNDLSHYEDFFASRAHVQSLVIGRDAEHPALFYQVNPRTTVSNSWGNIIFTRDSDLFAKAVAWCADTIGGKAARA